MKADVCFGSGAADPAMFGRISSITSVRNRSLAAGGKVDNDAVLELIG
jgi:hypothetical protein